MLTPHRRHLKSCKDIRKGWNYTSCECPLWCDGLLNGKRFRKALDTMSLERALLRIKALERGDADALPDTRSVTISTAIAGYFKEAEERNLKSSTVRRIRPTLAVLADAHGKAALSEMTLDHLRETNRRVGGVPRTQRTTIKQLRAFCAYCVRVHKRSCVDNLAKAMVLPLTDDVPTMPFTPEEIRKILAACDDMTGLSKSDTVAVRIRARALVLCLLHSGLRVSDVAQLKRSALEPSNHLVLRIMKTGVPLKVKLNDATARALRALPTSPNGNPTYFFWGGDTRIDIAANNLLYTVHRVGKRAGVANVHPHRFRDTFSVELLNNDVSIRTVQQLLGHKSVQTTEQHYGHFVIAHQKLLDAAVSTLDFSSQPARPLLVGKVGKRRRNA